MRITITRTYNKEQTKGLLRLIDTEEDISSCRDITLFKCQTLELPWKNNEIDLSCIPEGIYEAVKHISPNFGQSIWIKDVPNRTEILIHKGNFAGSVNPKTGTPDIKGCILVGEDFIDFTNDGIDEVTNSSKTIEKLYSLITEPLTVEIQ